MIQICMRAQMPLMQSKKSEQETWRPGDAAKRRSRPCGTIRLNGFSAPVAWRLWPCIQARSMGLYAVSKMLEETTESVEGTV